MPFFRVSFSPIFSGMGNQKKAIFWSRLSKHIKRRNLARSGRYLVQFMRFGIQFWPIFAVIGYHLKAKMPILEPGKKFLPCAHPYKFRSSTPSGHVLHDVSNFD